MFYINSGRRRSFGPYKDLNICKVIRKFIDVFMKKKHDHHWKANIVYDFCIIEFIAQSQSL